MAVPAWWQLLKGFYELGVDVIATPYIGKSIESLWWKSYTNPCKDQSSFVNWIIRARQSRHNFRPSKKTKYTVRTQLKEKTVQLLTRGITAPQMKKHIDQILSTEKDIQAVLFCTIPLNQIKGIPTYIKRKYGLPILYYEMDMPDSLPRYSVDRLAFDHYIGSDLSEYDAFITNSEGVLHELKEMGASRVYSIHFGVDPDIYSMIDVDKDIDIFFYGQGDKLREKWIKRMITSPSTTLKKNIFTVGGFNFSEKLGRARLIGNVPISLWRRYCCRSKINLNITRRPHAETYCSSTSRIFELASFGCCIVSNPVNGLDKWFDVDDEVIVVRDENESIETYRWLLSSKETRTRMGIKARQRVLREHTHLHMARKFLDIIASLK